MDFDDIIVETRDHIAVVTMNRPEKLNAFRAQTAFEMKDALDAIDADDDVRCVILPGAGRSFSSGHDTSEPQPDGATWLKVLKSHWTNSVPEHRIGYHVLGAPSA